MNRNNKKGSKQDVKLNVSSATRGNTSRVVANGDEEGSPNNSTPSPNSCVSSEADNSPEKATAVVAGCPTCLMYLMLPENDLKCPKCKSTALLDPTKNDSKKNKKG